MPPPTDSTSWVRWLQTSSWFGDLRIPPQALLGRQARALKDLSRSQLAALAAQQGFAGITQFEALPDGQICTWLRRVDFQPPALQPDAGCMMFDRPDHLIEVGVHEDYNEVWERLPDSTGRYVVLGGQDESGNDNGRRLLMAGAYVMLVRPRQARWPRGMNPGYTLTDVMLTFPERAHDWLDCEIAFGRLQQGHWLVEHATLPEREGRAEPFALQRVDEQLAHLTLGGHTAQWRVMEWSCSVERLTA